jgi:DNA polymerase I-like protein with 3'-5' exonuclease and polymerase domains
LTLSTAKTNKSTLEKAVEMIVSTKVVGLDLETTGLNPRRNKIRLVQVSDGERTFVVDAFRRDVRPIFEALATHPEKVVVHGGIFEYAFVYHHHGIALDNLVDTYLMARIAACGNLPKPCGLGDVASRLLGLELDKEMQESDWGVVTLSRRQLAYAAADAAVLPKIYRFLEKEIADSGQARVADLENEVLPAFGSMKLAGIPVDKAAWDAQAAENEAKLKALEHKMLDAHWMPDRDPVPQSWALQGEDCLAMLRAAGLTQVTGTTAKDLKDFEDVEIVKRLLAYRKAKGEERQDAKSAVLELAPDKPPIAAPPWNFGSPQQVAEISYLILGFAVDSTDEGMLLRYREYHPFFEHMLEHRKLKKQVTTYGKGWFQKAYDKETGRVYPVFRQIGTSTGRVSSGEKGVAPNAQNIPGEYREFFVAPPGRVFVDADYSQIEIRVVAKLLGEKVLLELFEDDSEDVYRATAARMMGVSPDKVSSKERSLAKAIVLGMIYGLSTKGLPYYAFKNFGIEDMTSDEAEEYVAAFYDLYPRIREYHDSTLAELNETGSVDRRTLTGRLRADITNRNEAINAPVQGTAADGLKAAMALVYKRLKRFGGLAVMVNTLHDEILVECDEEDGEEVRKLVVDAMLEAMDKLLNSDEPRVRLKVKSTVTKVWRKD